jgi:hypothetical protein
VRIQDLVSWYQENLPDASPGTQRVDQDYGQSVDGQASLAPVVSVTPVVAYKTADDAEVKVGPYTAANPSPQSPTDVTFIW